MKTFCHNNFFIAINPVLLDGKYFLYFKIFYNNNIIKREVINTSFEIIKILNCVWSYEQLKDLQCMCEIDYCEEISFDSEFSCNVFINLLIEKLQALTVLENMDIYGI